MRWMESTDGRRGARDLEIDRAASQACRCPPGDQHRKNVRALDRTPSDLRRICDMFGLSTCGASRYSAMLTHPDLQNAERGAP
jgi:hypothetical protein